MLSTDTTTRLAALAAAPYILIKIETREDREELNEAAARAGLPYTTNMCGGACDLCGTAIWTVYRFRGSDGREFKVGCDCAEKAFGREVVREQRRAYSRETREAAARVAREERLEAERDANELAGHGRVTNDEHAQIIIEQRAAEQKARRDASRHFGEVGQRVHCDLRYEGHYHMEGLYGWTTLYFLRRVDDHAAIVWKSTPGKLVGDLGNGVVDEPEKGSTFPATFTIKAHGEYKGEQQTNVSRLVVGPAKQKSKRRAA